MSPMRWHCSVSARSGTAGEIPEALKDHVLCQRVRGMLRNPGIQEQRANPAPLLHLGCQALGTQLPGKGGLAPLLGGKQGAR